ncbi:MAG: type I-F CRISPR-associated protein Csy2 [Pseudomonadales bacterium]|nr:type I-F CRISPR-associated protein Csy2 [Pseudomonadales bacterium]
MSHNLILLPHIQIHNANALSSPFTIGFPAMTAWLGAVHALQRKLNEKKFSVKFSATGVVVHHFDLQTYKGHGDFVNSIIGTGNPLEPKTEKGKPKGNAVRPSFIEEARCHLDVSLVIEYDNLEAQDEENLLNTIPTLLLGQMKLAGGDILHCQSPEIIRDFARNKYKLMPGYALLERRDLMIDAMDVGQDALDALLDHLALHHRCEKHNNHGEEQIVWQHHRKATGTNGETGWIIPIATGFHGISELGSALNQRDPNQPHRFAESVVTLGEFKMPYRLDSQEEMLWRYHVEPENNLYLCTQQTDLTESTFNDY